MVLKTQCSLLYPPGSSQRSLGTAFVPLRKSLDVLKVFIGPTVYGLLEIIQHKGQFHSRVFKRISNLQRCFESLGTLRIVKHVNNYQVC